MMKHCRAAPHGTWHQETGTLACLLPLASLWRTAVMNIILNVVKGQLRDIPCCSRYFLVNVLKIVNGRKYLSFKTFVRQQRTDTVWGRAGCGSGGCHPARGSAASGALKDRGSERVCSVVHEQEHCCSQPLLGATVSPKTGEGREEGISVHFWKSYKFLTLIHCDFLCFVLSGAPLL